MKEMTERASLGKKARTMETTKLFLIIRFA